MNKKNMLKMGVSLGLVGALGVGATLALLSDKTNTLTNTFAVSTKGISIKLDETDIRKTDGSRISVGGNNYGTLVSGQSVKKDPMVTVNAESLNANVFVKVTNNSEFVKYDTENIGPDKAWLDVTDEVKEIKGNDGNKKYSVDNNTKFYVYMKSTGNPEAVKDPTGDTYGVIASSDDDQPLDKVFNNITVNNFDNAGRPSTDENKNITVRAAAVQADAVTDAVALDTAVELLNSVE